MGIFDGLTKKETTSLFPEGQTLSSRTWTGNDLITSALKANVKDVMTVKLDNEKLKKVEEEARKLKPTLRIYTFNGCICYLAKDERRVYDLVQAIEKQMEPAKSYPPQMVTTKAEGLDGRIHSAEKQTPDVPDYLKKMEMAEEDPTDTPPTDIENRWAEEQLTEQLLKAEAEIRDAETLLASEQTVASATNESKPKKKRKSLGRTNRVQIRLTDSELVQFQRRVKGTGLTQGEFLRNAALNGEIIIKERSMADITLLDELTKLRAELGRQGGLLKMIIKPNEGLRQLAPNEWAELTQTIRDMEAIKQRLIELEAKISNGTGETSKQ